MPERVYPKIEPELERRLQAIEMLAKSDMDYFSDKACPYSPGLVVFLSRMLTSKLGDDRDVRVFDTENVFDPVLREVEETINEMKRIEQQIEDPGDKINLIKAKTTLLEKWTGVKERLYSMKEVMEFQRTVVGFMEEVLTKDQVQDFKTRLKLEATGAQA